MPARDHPAARDDDHPGDQLIQVGWRGFSSPSVRANLDTQAAQAAVATGSHERQPGVEVEAQAVEVGARLVGIAPRLSPRTLRPVSSSSVRYSSSVTAAVTIKLSHGIRHRGGACPGSGGATAEHIDSEGAGRLADEVADPGAAVLGLVAAEERPADAAGDDVVGAWVFIGDQQATGEGHIATNAMALLRIRNHVDKVTF